jgi:HAT1-interacting factor 1
LKWSRGYVVFTVFNAAEDSANYDQLVELRNPTAPENPMAGLLADMLGESPAQSKARIEEATKNANDISGLVKHKKKPKVEASSGAAASQTNLATNGKRKLDESDAMETEGKKAKHED